MKQRPIFFMIVILLFLAMACNLTRGGDDDSEETESSSSAEVAQKTESTEAQGPATAAAKAVGGAADSESAAEESTAAPTPTIAATPTDEPIVEATVASSEGIGSEGSSDSGDSSSSGSGDSGSDSSGGGASAGGDGWGESGSGAQSACDHPYFPMRVGSTWTFSDGTTMMVWEIYAVQGDMDNATANMRNTIDNITIEYEWTCSAKDGLSSFDFATLGIEDLGTQVTMDNMILEGTFLLPADQMVPGATWNLVLDGDLVIVQEAAGETMELTANMLSTQEFTVIGADPVTFENETFDGVQVEETNNLAIVMNVLGTEVAQEVNIGSLMQLGYGIGIVRQDYTSDFGSESQTLLSYFIP